MPTGTSTARQTACGPNALRKSMDLRHKRRSSRSSTTHLVGKSAKPMLHQSNRAPQRPPSEPMPMRLLSPNPHSISRSAQTHPAISRLSASPTPSNDPRYPNVARGVRETCTLLPIAAICANVCFEEAAPRQVQAGRTSALGRSRSEERPRFTNLH
jgi:hypothetical protein